jgi:hypothetical protein
VAPTFLLVRDLAHGFPYRSSSSKVAANTSGHGRVGCFAAAASHSFAQLATAIDDAFARWDRSHGHEFQLGNGTRIGTPDPEWDGDEPTSDAQVLKPDAPEAW